MGLILINRGTTVGGNAIVVSSTDDSVIYDLQIIVDGMMKDYRISITVKISNTDVDYSAINVAAALKMSMQYQNLTFLKKLDKW